MQIQEFEARLNELEKLPALNSKRSIKQALSEAGFSRRDFMKWAGAMTAFMALPASFVPVVARAAELADRAPVIWLHMAECTGCSESLLRSETPTIDSLIFEHISLEYHETVMAASGWQAEQTLENSMKKHKGNYILMVEGGIPTGNTESYLTLGAHGKTGFQIAKEACENAKAILAIGTCSSLKKPQHLMFITAQNGLMGYAYTICAKGAGVLMRANLSSILAMRARKRAIAFTR